MVNFLVILELALEIVTKYNPLIKFWKSKSIVFFPIDNSIVFDKTTDPKALKTETEAVLTLTKAVMFIDAFELDGLGNTSDTLDNRDAFVLIEAVGSLYFIVKENASLGLALSNISYFTEE